MTALLDVVRDVLLVAALAWVGVTVEPKPSRETTRHEDMTAQSSCTQTSMVVAAGQNACTERTVMFSSTPNCAADQ